MAMIADWCITKLAEDAYALLKNEVVLLSGADSEIQQLEDTFSSIQTVLADADRKRVKDGAVNKWLMDLKDLMYDADDVLDECRIKAEKDTLLHPTRLLRLSLAPYFHKIVWGCQIKRRIRIINARLEKISAEKSKFSLTADIPPSPPQISRKTSHISDPDIVGLGIEEDKSSLVELLIGNSDHKKPCVRAIVGIGGIGKTELARKIYNDERITAHFHIKLWVSVTQDFTDTGLLTTVAQQLVSTPMVTHYRDSLMGPREFLTADRSRTFIESIIRDEVGGKRFCLVLDDLWCEGVWHDVLRGPLQGAAQGSQVLITTRKVGVAERVGAVDIHNAQLMSPEDGWALLRKKVTFIGEDDDVESLRDLGFEIVKKCGRIPLAIKAIGGVLCNKAKRRREWEAILHNSNWSVTGLPEGVHAALYLSYEDLPSALKNCFLYISLFPLAPFFGKRDLIQYAIAEGFIKGQNCQCLEELGNEYYLDLLQRGLIQRDPLSYDFGTCIVHDLLQTLAQFLAQGESLVRMNSKSWVTQEAIEGWSSSISIKPRRLSTRISQGEMKNMVNFAQKNTYLRSLFLRSSRMNDNDLHYLVNTATRLRVLDLRWSNITKLPESLGLLIHLRLLVLTSTTIAEIPESIGGLVSLQFLRIQGCENLHAIPRGISKLQKLRCLDVYNTNINGLPRGIGVLKNLNVLQGFVLSEKSSDGSSSSSGQSSQPESVGNWSTLEEVRVLTNLTKLTIHKIERVFQESTIRESVLRDMARLEILELEMSTGIDYCDERIQKSEEIFGVVLVPPSSTEILIIKGFVGRKLPCWFMLDVVSSFLPRLRRLELHNCKLLEQLPPLGMLPNLDYLEVANAHAIKTIGNEFLGRSSFSPFPKLTTLIFTEMVAWEEWNWVSGEQVAFPRLDSLELNSCALTCLPPQLSSNSVPLKRLHIIECCSLRELSGFPCVRNLVLVNIFLMHLSGFPTLECMIFEDTDRESLPEWICPGLPALKKLIMFVGIDLLRKCYKDGVEWPKIQHIPFVHVHYQNYYVQKSPLSYSTGISSCRMDAYLSFLGVATERSEEGKKEDYVSRQWGNLE
ncbi:hypothetical protein LUZ60_017710 [Juncus effusus]|nr:hypothetical protein LUZ60_017710 [Juncus effusus]